MSKFIYAHAGNSNWKVALGSCRGRSVIRCKTRESPLSAGVI